MDQPIILIKQENRSHLFQSKIIFIISHENWGKMLLSKHHYAIELGKAGNKVFFLNHPDNRKTIKRGEVTITSTQQENVFSVSHRLLYPYFLKFRFKALYNFLTARQIRKMIMKIGSQPDIVWSFDSGNTLPLKYFPGAQLRILMPVDGPFGHQDEIRSSEGAHVIISVTDDILKTFSKVPVPKLRIDHGVSDVFLNERASDTINDEIRIGYSGSLFRTDLDLKALIRIIESHPDKVFEFWGEYDVQNSNIHLPQNISATSINFISKLKNYPNVVLHGAVDPQTLAKGINRMDALMISYTHDCQNSHKVLEYLGTGKVVISSKISTYLKKKNLIRMTDVIDSESYVKLFEEVVSKLSYYNSKDLVEQRKDYAKQFSYRNNIRHIEKFIVQNLSRD